MSTSAGDDAFLHELEVSIRTELTVAETSKPKSAADDVPIDQWLPDPDAERYEIRLRTLLGAVEALEGNSDPGPGTETEDPRAVLVTRQHVVDILRIAGLRGPAEEARRVLPDPVEYDHADRFLARYGITKDELISRRGGSP